jgi:hypothetical protein
MIWAKDPQAFVGSSFLFPQSSPRVSAEVPDMETSALPDILVIGRLAGGLS